MKRFTCIIALFLLMGINLSACGYGIHGYNDEHYSKLGDGNNSVSIGEIVQSSLYPDIPYVTASLIRDEIALRRLAKWLTQGDGDYIINVNIPTFRLRSFGATDIVEDVFVSSLNIVMVMTIHERKTGELIWTSNRVSYSENYENPQESLIIKNVLSDVIKQIFDKFQSSSF